MSATTHANWFQTFFEGVAVELWSEFVKHLPTAAEVDYLERQLKVQPGASILDVPCGAGRHSVEFARRGYNVVGVDLSRDSIEAARSSAKAANVPVDFRLADMRTVEGPFDGAFCWGNSFGYLPHHESQQFLRNLARSLKPGARFVLQSHACAESIFPHYGQEDRYQVNDIDFRLNSVYEPEGSVMRTEFSFTRGGKTETRLGWQSIYTSGELCRMLEEAGFKPIDLHKEIDGQAFEIGAPTLLLTAQRA